MGELVAEDSEGIVAVGPDRDESGRRHREAGAPARDPPARDRVEVGGPAEDGDRDRAHASAAETPPIARMVRRFSERGREIEVGPIRDRGHLPDPDQLAARLPGGRSRR